MTLSNHRVSIDPLSICPQAPGDRVPTTLRILGVTMEVIPCRTPTDPRVIRHHQCH